MQEHALIIAKPSLRCFCDGLVGQGQGCLLSMFHLLSLLLYFNDLHKWSFYYSVAYLCMIFTQALRCNHSCLPIGSQTSGKQTYSSLAVAGQKSLLAFSDSMDDFRPGFCTFDHFKVRTPQHYCNQATLQTYFSNDFNAIIWQCHVSMLNNLLSELLMLSHRQRKD